MQPFKAGFDEFEMGLACLNFLSQEHVQSLAQNGPDAVYRALASDSGIQWDRFMAQTDFNVDPLLNLIMADRAVDPFSLAVESVINAIWAERHFDPDRMADQDRYHLYRMRHFSIVQGALVPRNRLAVELLTANREFAGACWAAFEAQKPVDFATEDAMMTPNQLQAIQCDESVRGALRQFADQFASLHLIASDDGSERECGRDQIARQYEYLTGVPLYPPTVN